MLVTSVFGSSVTVIIQLAFFNPHTANTDVTPSPTAVTFPFSTVATLGSRLCQVTVLSVAFSGFTVAISVPLSPTCKFMEDTSSVRSVI